MSVARRVLAVAIALNLAIGVAASVVRGDENEVRTAGRTPELQDERSTSSTSEASLRTTGTVGPTTSTTNPPTGPPTTVAPTGPADGDAPPPPAPTTTTTAPPPATCPPVLPQRVSGFAGEGVYRAGRDGSRLQLLVRDGFGGAISPDGSQLLFAMPRIWCIGPTAGGRSSSVLGGIRPIGGSQGASAAWSPDGRRIAFVRHHPNSDPVEEFVTQVVVADVRTGSSIALEPRGSRRSTAVDWSSDGRLVVAAGGRIEVLDSNGGNPRTVCQRSGWLLGQLQWVPGSSAVLGIDNDGNLVAIDTDLARCESIGHGAFSFDFRSDGTGMYTPESVLKVRAAGGAERVVTSTSADAARWLDGAKRVAFLHVDQARTSGGTSMRVVGADGTGERVVMAIPAGVKCLSLGIPLVDRAGSLLVFSTQGLSCLPGNG